MEKDILATVIEAEREVGERLESERSRAARWLDGVKGELAKQLETEARKMEEELRLEVVASRAKAEAEAARIVREAEDESLRLAGLDDGTLTRVIAQHIGAILPERERDRQDVED